ncbi:MAG TPA: precorrin-3B C(17)-methyltransferase [Actinophytocola sp.]|uniref:precorrin-3B C(17)-methyltransferase n=1 Tax=Actinophytocola sp. TaxID=1872138 RepID=UPI002DDCCD8A|nr:precorrin-3B C(17)-methyltransferase [Actinophytocola sp.]HEV2780876.1 precorrin-3B C(17)-methyltransferase [Actinophytocola sp.]
MSAGTLYGVGLGPGDPELITIKAARLIGAADVIAYHCARHGRSIARSVAEPYLRGDQIEEPLTYPLTVETTDHPGGYPGAIADFYTESAAKLAVHLDAGRSVVLLCEGDPLFYGSYMHMHKRLAPRYRTEVVPGVTSVSAAAAVAGRPLVEGEEILTVLPGTLPSEVLTEHLTGAGPAAVLKLGRTFEKVRKALLDAGRLDDALYVERATWPEGRIGRLSEVDPNTVPYFSLALLPSTASLATQPTDGKHPPPSPGGGPASILPAQGHGEINNGPGCGQLAGCGEVGGGVVGGGGSVSGGGVIVVGLGPGGRGWLTPEAQEALAWADELVGYGPYLERVPANPRQRRHASDNRVEAERARLALGLARAGARVAVVSSGDPGVFAMASAVLEAAEDPQWMDVPVRVVPGLTAAQAVASRVGAPLGHDFCTISLSDRLKPWEIIARRLDAAAAADFVIAIYNPASRSRRHQLDAARKLLLEHRAPGTPVVVGRDVGGAGESVEIVRLGELDTSTVDMRCLLIVGSSRTRVVERVDGTRAVFTPRGYPAS